MLHNLNKIIIIKNNFNVEGGTAAAAYSITVQWQSTNSIALEYSVPIRRFLHFTTLRKKIKYFVLEPSFFGVKTLPSMENSERENKILLSSTNFQD